MTRPIGSRFGTRVAVVTVEPYLLQDPDHPDPQIPWPPAGSPHPAADQEDGVASAMPVDGSLILVVEDDEDTRDVYAEILETNGFEVRTAASGPDGLRLARGLHPRAILMDISLPDMDGWTVTSHLKADPDTRGIPVIIVTAYAFPEDRSRAHRMGCEGFLSKPCEPSRVLAEVQRLLGTDGSS